MKRGVWLVLVLLLGGWDLFRSPNPDVERGNVAFRDGKYDEALEAYGKAAKQLPNDPGVKFNRGVALYQKALNTPAGPAREQLLAQAQGEFLEASQAPDRTLRGASHYNLGNTHFQQQDWDKAVKEYKQSIKEDPANPDARYNLELALRQREQKKQQQQQQQQQGQGQQKQQQGQQQQDQQQKPGQQDQQQQDKQQQGQQPQDKQQPGQQDQQQQDQQQQGQQGQQPQQKKPSGQDQTDQQEGQDPNHPPEPKDQQNDPNNPDRQGQPRGKPAGPQRKTYGDAENKMDALERRSKDLKVQQQRGRGESRRGKVKDW